MLESLIGHAHQALEMTGDPLLVEMVFQRLRKEAADRQSTSKLLLENRPKPSPKKRAIKYTMSADQLAAEAWHLMKERSFDYLPVVDANGRYVGLLDVQDFLIAGFEVA